MHPSEKGADLDVVGGEVEAGLGVEDLLDLKDVSRIVSRSRVSMINLERRGGAGAGAACLLQLEHEDEAIDLVQRRVAAVRHQGSAAPRPVPSPCSPPSAEGRAPSTPAAMTWVERDVLRAVPVRPRILEPDVRPWPATAVISVFLPSTGGRTILMKTPNLTVVMH